MDEQRTRKKNSVKRPSKKEKIYSDMSCRICKNYPCFRGIDNLEADFAQEGCKGFEFKKLNK